MSEIEQYDELEDAVMFGKPMNLPREKKTVSTQRFDEGMRFVIRSLEMAENVAYMFSLRLEREHYNKDLISTAELINDLIRRSIDEINEIY